jgi:hypothetical protein
MGVSRREKSLGLNDLWSLIGLRRILVILIQEPCFANLGVSRSPVKYSIDPSFWGTRSRQLAQSKTRRDRCGASRSNARPSPTPQANAGGSQRAEDGLGLARAEGEAPRTTSKCLRGHTQAAKANSVNLMAQRPQGIQKHRRLRIQGWCGGVKAPSSRSGQPVGSPCLLGALALIITETRSPRVTGEDRVTECSSQKGDIDADSQPYLP